MVIPTVNFKTGVAKNTVVLQEVSFTMTNVTISEKFSTGEGMIVDTKTAMPKHLLGNNRVVLDECTLVFLKKKRPCNYQIIKTVISTPEILNNDRNKIVINLADTVHIQTHSTLNAPYTCPINVKWVRTGHADMVLVNIRQM